MRFEVLITLIVFSLTALLVGEKLPPEAEIDVSNVFISLMIFFFSLTVTEFIIFLRMILLNWKVEELWTWRESKIGIGICKLKKYVYYVLYILYVL